MVLISCLHGNLHLPRSQLQIKTSVPLDTSALSIPELFFLVLYSTTHASIQLQFKSPAHISVQMLDRLPHHHLNGEKQTEVSYTVHILLEILFNLHTPREFTV